MGQALRIFHLENVKDFIGFSLENATAGNMVNVRYRAALTSDDSEFYGYADIIAREYLNQVGVSVDGVHHLLIVIHADLSADVYVNNIPITVDMRPKKDIPLGGNIMKSDIADIGKLSFPDIEIRDSDKVIFCFKVGWRFGLYFDVGPREWSKAKVTGADSKLLDIELMKQELGGIYRHLLFYDVFKTLSAGSGAIRALENGWFPFIEILGSEYDTLATAYKNDFDVDQQEHKLVETFDDARLARVTDKWWKNPTFSSKRQFIDAALNAYRQDTPDGFINCIKNLATELEGVLRELCRADTGTADLKSPALINHVIEKARLSAGSDSLFLPDYFLNYMSNVVFANFDGEDENPSLSRHTVGHGAARSEAYTKARALQFILTLDQIYFFAS